VARVVGGNSSWFYVVAQTSVHGSVVSVSQVGEERQEQGHSKYDARQTKARTEDYFPARLTCTVFDEVIFSAIAPQFPLVLVVTAACRELKAVRTPVRRSGRAISTFTRSVSAGAWARHQARLTLVNYWLFTYKHKQMMSHWQNRFLQCCSCLWIVSRFVALAVAESLLFREELVLKNNSVGL